MGITLANNAHTTLSADASSTDTVIYVEDIDSFPSLDVGDYFYLTLERTSGAQEIVKVTQINASSFNVERGAESTIPISFPIGSMAKLNMTVQNITDLILTGSNVNDDAFDSSWNGDTSDAPSRNAVYDKFVAIDTTLGTVYAAGGTDVALADGGTGASLTDPNADRIMFWDDSAGQVTWLQPNSPLSINGTGLNWSTNALSVGGSGTTTASATVGHNAGGGATASLVFSAAGNSAWDLTSSANTNDNLTLTANNAAGGGAGAGLVLTIPRTTGVAAFAITPTVPDDAYAAGWNGSTQVPTKNAVYDKIETLLPSASYTAADVLSKLLTVDGAGSGLDADLLDGISSAAFAQLSGAAFTGGITGTTASFSGASSFTSGSLTVGFNKLAGDSALTLASDANLGNSTSIIWTADSVTKWYLRHSGSNGSIFLRNNTLGTSAVSFAAADNAATFTGTITVPDDAYAAGWDGNLTVPTKNAVYDKIQSLGVLSDGDKGDITVSASGATWTIDNNTVTLAKMATMATDSILGRATASTGNVEVLTALPFAFTGDVTRAADSNAQTIANSAVTLAKMANLNQYELIGRSTAGAGAPEAKATSANVWTMLGSADNATIRSNIGLAIGTNVQAYSAILAALAASSNITGTITVSTSAPSGGSSGDVWYERAA